MNNPTIISIVALNCCVLAGCSGTATKPAAIESDNESVVQAATPSNNKQPSDKASVISNPEAIDGPGDSLSGTIQTGRYTAITPSPTYEQTHILDVIIDVSLPEDDLSSVGQAIHYVLKRSGYRLVQPSQLSPDVLLLFAKPIPSVHRHLGPMPLRDALNTLATPAFRLIDDPVHRLISFQPILTDRSDVQ